MKSMLDTLHVQMTNVLVIWTGVLVMNELRGRQATRQGIAQKILIGCAVAGLLTGAGGSILKEAGIVLPRMAAFSASVFIVAVLFWVSIIYWRNLDEAAREAHKFAWFWGATGGMLVMLPIAALVSAERLVAVLGQRGPAEWVALGFASLLLAQLAGYGLVWAGWWLRQR